jgi:hypothetical protein
MANEPRESNAHEVLSEWRDSLVREIVELKHDGQNCRPRLWTSATTPCFNPFKIPSIIMAQYMLRNGTSWGTSHLVSYLGTTLNYARHRIPWRLSRVIAIEGSEMAGWAGSRDEKAGLG